MLIGIECDDSNLTAALSESVNTVASVVEKMAPNIVPLENRRGRHTNAYHNFIADVIDHLGAYSNGSHDLFVKGMEALKDFVKEHSWLPYAQPK